MFDIPESIVDAIESCDFECVKKYVNELETDKRNTAKNAMLMNAVYNSNTRMVTFFINLGAKVDLRDERGTTPLMVASNVGDIRLVRVLIRKKANIHLTDDTGESALTGAIRGEHHDVISYLAPIIFADPETKYAEVALSHLFPRRPGYPENYPHIQFVSNLFSEYYFPRSTRDASFGEEMALDIEGMLGKTKNGKPILPEDDCTFLRWCGKTLAEQKQTKETFEGEENSRGVS